MDKFGNNMSRIDQVMEKFQGGGGLILTLYMNYKVENENNSEEGRPWPREEYIFMTWKVIVIPLIYIRVKGGLKEQNKCPNLRIWSNFLKSQCPSILLLGFWILGNSGLRNITTIIFKIRAKFVSSLFPIPILPYFLKMGLW